jgi:hypothetical protein
MKSGNARLTPTQQILEQADGPVLMDEGEPFAIVMDITPELAGDWVSQRNDINRPLREVTVKKYAAIILNDRWRLNGDTIKFNKAGKLLDGQHRLTAIVVSNQTVKCFVAFNIQDDAFATLDRPKKRSVADVLARQGEKNVAELAAALTWYWKYTEGRARVHGPEGWPEPDDILPVLVANPGLKDSIHATSGSRFRLLSGRTALAVCHYVLGSVDAEARDKFFELLGMPANLDEFHPIFKLRERLYADNLAKNKLAQHERIAIIYKAWNAWRAGRDVRQLSWRGGGEGKEAFPEPE